MGNGRDAPVVNKVTTLVNQYRDLFVDGPNDELGRTSVTEHSINTGDNRPIKQRPYRTPVHLQGEVNKQVNDMLTRGLIRPSHSPWSSPIVLAPKKNGTYRFCVDFRRVNAVTRKDAHPMPRVDDILDQLGGAKYFTFWLQAIGKYRCARKTSLKLHFQSDLPIMSSTSCPLV